MKDPRFDRPYVSPKVETIVVNVLGPMDKEETFESVFADVYFEPEGVTVVVNKPRFIAYDEGNIANDIVTALAKEGIEETLLTFYMI